MAESTSDLISELFESGRRFQFSRAGGRTFDSAAETFLEFDEQEDATRPISRIKKGALLFFIFKQ